MAGSESPSPSVVAPPLRERYLGLEAREWAAVAVGTLLGVAIGMLIHYVESLSTDVAYLADLIRAIVYVFFFVVFMIGIGQLTTGRRSLILGVVPFAIAAIIASGFGPSAVPAVDVPGRVELRVGRDLAVSEPATCTWAAGREKVERIVDAGVVPDGRHYALDVDRGRLRVALELDGGTYVALGSSAFASISGPAADARLALPLVQTLPTAPADIPAAIDVAIVWSCDSAPPT